MTSLNFRKINIEAYKPGRSILKKKKNVIKLSANESALGMSPKVTAKSNFKKSKKKKKK
jgi:histidinol-phosphate aminotransferase